MSYNQPPPPGGYGAPQPGAYGAPQPRPAELMDRFLARLIDFVLLMIISIVIGIIVGIILVATGAVAEAGPSYVVSAIAAVVTVAVWMAYSVFFETTSGQTLGKMAMKLKAVGPAGAPLTPAQAAKRNFIWALPILGLVPFVGGLLSWVAQIGAAILIAVTINKDTQLRQGFHDKLANESYVMKLG